MINKAKLQMTWGDVKNLSAQISAPVPNYAEPPRIFTTFSGLSQHKQDRSQCQSVDRQKPTQGPKVPAIGGFGTEHRFHVANLFAVVCRSGVRARAVAHICYHVRRHPKFQNYCAKEKNFLFDGLTGLCINGIGGCEFHPLHREMRGDVFDR